ncbi:MAG: hypothetical protein P8176_09345 [Gammaproteobacteria bacterium]
MSGFLTFIYNITFAVLLLLTGLIDRGISNMETRSEKSPEAILESATPEQFLSFGDEANSSEQDRLLMPELVLEDDIGEVYQIVAVWIQTQAQYLLASSLGATPVDPRDRAPRAPNEAGYDGSRRDDAAARDVRTAEKEGIGSFPRRLNADDEPVVDRQL